MLNKEGGGGTPGRRGSTFSNPINISEYPNGLLIQYIERAHFSPVLPIDSPQYLGIECHYSGV